MRTLLMAIIFIVGFKIQASSSEMGQFLAQGEGYWCYQDKRSAYQQALYMMKQNAVAQCVSGQAQQTTPVSEVTGPCSVEVRAGFICR